MGASTKKHNNNIKTNHFTTMCDRHSKTLKQNTEKDYRKPRMRP